jgi:RNA polymerase sigma-70 factor (ECF subfamily)
MTQVTAQFAELHPVAEATDEALLLRYRDILDIEAFETLVHRYEKPLFNYLLRYLHSPSLAEDVFQATFLRLHEKCDLFTKDRRFRPWLYSIATHLAIDALRREGRHRAASLDQERADNETDVGTLRKLLRSHTLSPPEQMQAEERAQWARQAVDGLPEYLRIIVLLVYFQGLKLQEVSEILQIPLGTVKSRLHKALLSLNTAWRRNHAAEAAEGLQK